MKNKKNGLSVILIGLLFFLYPQLNAVKRDIVMFFDIKNYKNSKMNTLEYIENIEKITKKDKVISESVIDVFNQDEQKNKEKSNLDEELIGYVYIPKIGLTYKLYDRASLEKLTKGVAILEGSNLPNDKNENRTVIAGHNMWEGTAVFRDIKTLESGDKVYVNAISFNYQYEVTDSKVIDKYDYQSISTVKNANILTLITCTNESHFDNRYIVNLKLINISENQDIKKEKLFQNFEINPPESPIDYLFDKNISIRQKIIRFEPYLLAMTTVAVTVFVLIKILGVSKKH